MSVSIQVTVEVPDNVINDADVRREIESMLRNRTGPELQRQFKKTVDGWEGAPSFPKKLTSKSNYLSVAVYASGTHADKYALVNFGSPPHPITPRRGGMLRFQPGYRAATKPRVIGSRAKSRSGRTIGARRVSHPGFEAREFDLAIAEEIAPRFAEDVQDAITTAATK